MEQRKETVDSVSVSRATDRARHYGEDVLKKAMGFLRDDLKQDRLKASECKTCFYIRAERIGGSAMTYRPCGVCDVQQLYGSTNTDVLCLKCSIEHQLCKYCGGDLLMRPRRMFRTERTNHPGIDIPDERTES